MAVELCQTQLSASVLPAHPRTRCAACEQLCGGPGPSSSSTQSPLHMPGPVSCHVTSLCWALGWVFGSTSHFDLTRFRHSPGCPRFCPTLPPPRLQAPHISAGLLGPLIHKRSCPICVWSPSSWGLSPSLNDAQVIAFLLTAFGYFDAAASCWGGGQSCYLQAHCPFIGDPPLMQELSTL